MCTVFLSFTFSLLLATLLVMVVIHFVDLDFSLFLYSNLLPTSLTEIKSVAHTITQCKTRYVSYKGSINCLQKTLLHTNAVLLPKFWVSSFKCEYNWAFIEFCNHQHIGKIWTILPELFPKNPAYRRQLREFISHRELSGLNTASFLLHWWL